MKKAKGIIVLLVCVCLVMQVSATGSSADQRIVESKGSFRDPFALMYDSNERLLQKLESIPDLSDISARVPGLENPSAGVKGTQQVGQSALDNAPDDSYLHQASMESVKRLVAEDRAEEIDTLELSPEYEAMVAKLSDDVKENRFIVKYRSSDKSRVHDLIGNQSSAFAGKSTAQNDVELVLLDEKVNPKDFADSLKAIGADRDIEYIQPDFIMEYASEEDGSLSLTVAPSSGVGEAGKNTDPPVKKSASEIVVAVIDTGIDVSHPALLQYIWNNQADTVGDGMDNDGNGYIDDSNGWNFCDGSNTVFNPDLPLNSAHGTHIAGIIAAQAADYNVKIMPLQVFGERGAYTSDILHAIQYAEQNGASIVNCSFGSTENNLTLKEAIQSSGMLFVCSVGNARTNLETTPVYPACFGLDNILSVASVNADGGLSYFSNYSASLADVAATGREVDSTLPYGEHGKQSGTSMAAAQVSGIAAAVLSTDETLDGVALKTRIIATSDRLSNLQGEVRDGRKVDLEQAIRNLPQTAVEQNTPADDFDVLGYNPTQSELYQLYSSSGKVVQVAAGETYTLALKEDGTVWSWGSNESGQCGNGSTSFALSLSQVIGLDNITCVAVRNGRNIALKSDGTVWEWGESYDEGFDDSSIPVQMAGLTDIADIAAGTYHNLALGSDGTVWAWGENYDGQLGDGTTTSREIPIQVSRLVDVIKTAAGYCHSLALKSDGTVWAWGNNDSGQLGDGTTTSTCLPAQVDGLTGVVDIAAGDMHGMVIKSDGTVWTWGENYDGQLGDGTTTSRSTPVQVSGLSGIADIAAGYHHNIALKSDKTVWGWGDNDYGQLGDGTTTSKIVPVQVSGLTDVVGIAAGDHHSLALKTDETVWAWGLNDYGQLQGGLAIREKPVMINSLTEVVDITAGSYHSVAVKNDGTVWTWGSNEYGQLGDEITTPKTTPTQLIGLDGVVKSTAGASHTLALKSNGTVWAWGYNFCGQLGNGTDVDSTMPVQVSGLTGVVSVTAGYFHSLALKSDGTIWGWGYNVDGIVMTRTTPVQMRDLYDIIGIAAGGYHNLALKSDGTVWSWGFNYYGELGNGTTVSSTMPVQVSGLTDIVSVEVGYSYSIALKSDGTVWAWGCNSSGQLGNGMTVDSTTPVQVSGLTDVICVKAGSSHCIALKSDGTIWAWGYNDYGQLGDGTITTRTAPVQVYGLANVKKIAAGGCHGLALGSDGKVWAWGNDQNGQLGLSRILQTSVPIQAQEAYTSVFGFNQSSYTAEIPPSGTNTVTMSASGTDAYGNPITSGITYSLASPYPGVTVDSETGVITVSPQAQEGTATVKAQYQDLTCTASLILTRSPAGGTSLDLSPDANGSYSVSLRMDKVSAFTGQIFTLTYDSSVLEITDLCALTYKKETTPGAIPGAGITVTDASPGEVTFAVSKTIPAGKTWSGVVNIFKFKALSSEETQITVHKG